MRGTACGTLQRSQGQRVALNAHTAKPVPHYVTKQQCVGAAGWASLLALAAAFLCTCRVSQRTHRKVFVKLLVCADWTPKEGVLWAPMYLPSNLRPLYGTLVHFLCSDPAHTGAVPGGTRVLYTEDCSCIFGFAARSANVLAAHFCPSWCGKMPDVIT